MWGNAEYVVEQQPYQNIAVYIVHPTDREGCNHTLHRNYQQPINNNLENRESAKSVGGAEPIDGPALELHTGDALLVDCLARVNQIVHLICYQDWMNQSF